jgi:hypothetical protein
MNALAFPASSLAALAPSSAPSLTNDFLPYSTFEPSAADWAEWNAAMEARDYETESVSASDFERDRDRLPYSPYDPSDEDEYDESDDDGLIDAEADALTYRDAGMGTDEDYGD